MRLIFAGTPEFAAQALGALLSSRHTVVLVLTQPDRPAGRGMQQKQSEVKRLALAHQIEVRQPVSLRDPEEQRILRTLDADLMVVAAYGLILPQAVLDIPRLGAINIHASLLPRWRGAAPIQRALLEGDQETGISIMQMEAGLDTGPVMLMRSTPIQAHDTSASLHDRLAAMGAELVLDAIDQLDHGTATFQPQDSTQAVYASKIGKDEARLDWRLDARVLDRRVRAFNPFPGASSVLQATDIKIWRAFPMESETGSPGQVLRIDARGPVVACGQGALCLEELQRPGGKRLPAKDWLRGFPISPGELFTS